MARSGLESLLAGWLPAQRWFAGYGVTVRDIEVTSDLMLAEGDPEFRHLIVEASVGAEKVAYQVPLALRRELPEALAPAGIGVLDGRIAYDAAADPELTSALLAGIAAGRRAGQVVFTAAPGAIIDAAAGPRTLPQTHSNTSVVFGDQAIMKLLRRPVSGRHPDLEVPAALARAGSRLVAPPLGWIELAGGPGGEPVVLAIVSRYFTGAIDGWTAALDVLGSSAPDFTSQARLLGRATAELHAELADAFGTSVLGAADLAALAGALSADLARAVDELPRLAGYQARIKACYDQLREPGRPVVAQRIHGDYHLGQVLRTDAGWLILDFEGEPSVPLGQRTAYAPALRDVAGMLRSFDYAARHRTLGRPAGDPAIAAAARWTASCQREFCGGYAEVSGTDPLGSGPLLRALTFAKAVYEAVYEVRHRPDWLPIPLAALAEAHDDTDG